MLSQYEMLLYTYCKSAPEKHQITRKLVTSESVNWILCVCGIATLIVVMFIKSIWIGFVGIILFVVSASAASSALQGIVKDANGHPVQGADIRIEATNSGRLLTTVKTNGQGRYTLEGLAAGNYRVTVVVSGTVKASINNTTLEPGESTRLNFELKQRRASASATKGTHRIWVPPFTGSRLPGRWIEVDDSSSWAGAHISTENVVQVSAEELQRIAHSRADRSPP